MNAVNFKYLQFPTMYVFPNWDVSLPYPKLFIKCETTLGSTDLYPPPSPLSPEASPDPNLTFTQTLDITQGRVGG